jgi:hypothetical protein
MIEGVRSMTQLDDRPGAFVTLAKLSVILLTAEILAHLAPGHRGVLRGVFFGLGLCLGIVIQLAIPPRNNWKKQVLLLIPIAVLIGAIDALLPLWWK